MSDNFKIVAQFVKDISSETPNIETYFYVKEFLKNYSLSINITSAPLKNRMIEVNTQLTYMDKGTPKNKSHFEITYTSVVQVDEDVKEKKIIEKIVLCDVQKKIYPNLEKIFINLLNDSGYPGVKFDKKVDFENLYKEQFN